MKYETYKDRDSGNKDSYMKLVDLFQQVEREHCRAFAKTDGFDPEWPLWWSEFMINELNTLLGTIFTKSELVYYLVKCDKEKAADLKQVTSCLSRAELFANFFWNLLKSRS